MTSSSTFSSRLTRSGFWRTGWGVLLLFALGCFVADRGLGSAIDQLFERVTTGEGAGVTRGILARARKAQVLILGSSRARHHLNTEVLEANGIADAFNGGINGQGIPAMAAVATLSLQEKRHPGTFILVVDPREILSPDPSRVALFAPFYGASRQLDRQLEKQIPWGEFKLRSHTFRYNSKLLPIVRNAVSPGSIGYEGLRGQMRSVPEPEPPRGKRIDEEVLALYGRTVMKLREANVEVISLIGPRLWPQSESAQAAQFALRDATEQAGGAFCPMVDLGAAYRSPKLYRDPHHLNDEGAAKFSKEVAETLIQLRANPSHCGKRTR